MARIQTATPGTLLRSIAKRQYGYVPGITQVGSPPPLTSRLERRTLNKEYSE
jgi:hypothetical protein